MKKGSVLVKLYRKFISLISITLITFAMPIPNAWPIFGGQQSISNPIVVGLLRSQFATSSGCSGALVAPQVVFTAAHCLNGQADNFWIAAPGTDLRDTTTLRIQAKQMLVPDGFSTVSFPYQNDFGILILESSFPNAKTLKIASSEEIENWVARESDVVHIGYGCTDLVDLPPCGKTSPVPFQFETQFRKSIPPQFASLTPKTFTVTKISVDKTICGGDSGSPLLKSIDGSWIYIGAQSSSNGAGCTKTCNELCSASQGLPAANPALIAQIQKYLDVPIPASSIKPSPMTSPTSTNMATSPSKKTLTIICIKGKSTKIVTSLNPKCPTGWKKK